MSPDAAKDKKQAANQRQYRSRRLRRAGLVERESDRKILVPLRIPEGIMGRVMRLLHEGIAKGSHPWKTQSEILRAMIVKGLEALKGDSELIDEMMPYLRLSKQFELIGQSRREAQASLGRATHEIRELIGIGAKREALAYYHVTKHATLQMAPTAWRDWMLDQLRKSFGELDKIDPQGVELDLDKVEVKMTKREKVAAEATREKHRLKAVAKIEKEDQELWDARMTKDREEIQGSRKPVVTARPVSLDTLERAFGKGKAS